MAKFSQYETVNEAGDGDFLLINQVPIKPTSVKIITKSNLLADKMGSLAEDTAPKLGGNLDNNGKQILIDASGLDITTPPIKFSYPDMTDDESSKGGIIEWGGIMEGGTSYPYGIATQAYKDNPAATFTAPGVGNIYRKWSWVTTHYDSPLSTGEDIHQHFNIETVKADWLTAITRLQISFGEDVALVSFPNSNVKVYNDKYLQIGTDANGLYIEHDTANSRIDMTSTSPISFNNDIKIGATEAPGATLDVEESADQNMLRLESTLGSANGSAQLLIKGTTAGGTAIQSGLSGEGTNRFSMNTSGRMEWGSGSASRDVNLYRSAANVLKTDDKFVATLGLNMGTAGTGVPSSASATGTAGDIAYDSNYIYICTATNTWKRTALTTW